MVPVRASTSKPIHAIIAAADAVFVVAKSQHRGAVRRERGSGIEAEPSEPQHAGAEDDERNVRWDVRFAREVALPPPQDMRAGERGQTRGHVHHGAAGEIEHAPLAQEPLRMPRPVRERRVDDEAEKHTNSRYAAEAHALGERAGDQRRRDDGELQLEQREQQQRESWATGGVLPDLPEHEKVSGCR